MSARRIQDELAPFLRLALPLIATQVAAVAMPWTDALVMARLGSAELAGGGLGATILSLFTISTACLLGGLSALIAAARASGELERVRHLLQQGRLIALAAGSTFAALTTIAQPLLRLAGQSEEVCVHASSYLLAAAPAFVAMPLGAVQRQAFAAIGRPRIVALAWACAVPLNAALDLALSNGVSGVIVPMGITGVALATSIVTLALAVALEVLLRRVDPTAAAPLLGRADAKMIVEVLALGAPIAAAVLVEVGVFSAASIAAGWYGTGALAAHQVAAQVAQILFVVPNGLAQAAAVRVAQSASPTTAARVTLGLAACWGAGTMAVLAATRGVVARVYLPESESSAGETASVLLLVVALFQLADAVQVAAAGALRGSRDTKSAMRWGLVAYVGVVPICGWALMRVGLGVLGIWIALALGLVVAAIALSRRALSPARMTVAVPVHVRAG